MKMKKNPKKWNRKIIINKFQICKLFCHLSDMTDRIDILRNYYNKNNKTRMELNQYFLMNI